MSNLLFTGPGAAPTLPAGAAALTGTECTGLFMAYISETGDSDCGDMDVVAAWIEKKYGSAKSLGFTWRTNFAF